MHSYKCCLVLHRMGAVPRSAHLRESRTSQRQAPGPMSRMLIQLRTPCHALVQRRHLQSHHFYRARRSSHSETCCGCSTANDRDARSDPHVEVSTHAPESVAHPCCAASGPGPECPVHGGVDTDASTLAACASLRHASKPFALRQSPGGLPPRGVAVTMVSPQHHEDVRRL
jgi:hypothetical protein